jgi:hypothetical protein
VDAVATSDLSAEGSGVTPAVEGEFEEREQPVTAAIKASLAAQRRPVRRLCEVIDPIEYLPVRE